MYMYLSLLNLTTLLLLPKLPERLWKFLKTGTPLRILIDKGRGRVRHLILLRYMIGWIIVYPNHKHDRMDYSLPQLQNMIVWIIVYPYHKHDRMDYSLPQSQT